MAKLLCSLMTVFLLVSLSCTPSFAAGIADFVAVADSSSGAVGNPAGLADMDSRTLSWEHRFTDRDESNIGWDDLIVYNAPGRPGNGAIFYAYNQDLVTPTFYWQTVSYGYAYGWRVSDLVAFGVTLKNVTLNGYDNSTGIMILDTSETNIMFDFGLQMKLDPKWQLGLAVHNIGRSNDAIRFSYETTLGIAYQADKLTFAAEIYDYLNEGGNPNYRLGCRYELIPGFRPWIVLLMTDDGSFGESFGLEYKMGDHLNLDASWIILNTNSQKIDSIKMTIGYRF